MLKSVRECFLAEIFQDSIFVLQHNISLVMLLISKRSRHFVYRVGRHYIPHFNDEAGDTRYIIITALENDTEITLFLPVVESFSISADNTPSQTSESYTLNALETLYLVSQINI